MVKGPDIGRRTFFFIVLSIILYLGYQVVVPYLSVIVLAFVTVFIFKPIYEFFLKVTKKESIASGLSVFVVILAFLIPMLIVGKMTIDQTEKVVSNVSAIIEEGDNPFENQIESINLILERNDLEQYKIENENVTNFLQENLNPAANFILDRAIDVGSLLSELMPKLIVYVFLLGTLFPNSDKVLTYIKRLSPLDDGIDELYLRKVIGMSKSMVQGSFVIAIVQGIIAGIVLQIVGVEYVFFLTILMIFLSIIPLGSGVINIPIGLWFVFLGNNIVGGLLILLNHFLVITNVDNILRPRLVSKDIELDPNLTLIAVLGGVSAFGFMGVIYGPVIMIFLVTTFEVYLKHYQKK